MVRVVTTTLCLLWRLLASDSEFGVASDSGFGEVSDSVFKETLDSLFGVASDTGFSVASDSGFSEASDSEFGVSLETDSCMRDIWTDNLYTNEVPIDQVFFETNMIQEDTLETHIIQDGTETHSILINKDQNLNGPNAPTEDFDPDTNLYLFLNDQSGASSLDLALCQEQPADQQYITTQDVSQVVLVDNSINAMEMNDPFGYVEYLDQTLLLPSDANDQLMDMGMNFNKKSTNKKKPDNRHKKGPKPLPKEAIKDEEKWKNVKRCRDYRKNKTNKVTVEKTELEILEAQNLELKMEEETLKERVTRMKGMYIKLISEGRIRFGSI